MIVPANLRKQLTRIEKATGKIAARQSQQIVKAEDDSEDATEEN